jgi:predicted phosphodiesterase
MRYLVLSDVHGNRFGLEAALQAASGQYEQVLCLGDVVGYGLLLSRIRLCDVDSFGEAKPFGLHFLLD